ncbi:hypothetical protein NEMBOFW57_006783 [Staphylotrichum longicolle]|uniref:C2H2-type domain-containing protein n=1 Tax=Staphylotrichum longicolle TaxID=669026 RepID=A0AAD4ETA8_9PEZI|nr:hypothetical protein NEMBOFW57_006783 [Staphylotrichum longicolle]
MQMDPRNGQGGYLPAVYGTEFDGTVNPQNLALPGLSVPEVELSGAALWEPNDPTLPQEPFQNAFHEEEQSTGFDPAVVLAVGLPIGHLEEVPISAGASIPGAPDPHDTASIVAGGPAETGHGSDFNDVLFDYSFSDDFSTFDLQQTPAGGVGTTAPFYDSSATSSFALDLDISTPLLSPYGSFSHDTSAPLTPTSGPTTPESSFSDLADDNSNHTPDITTSAPGEYRCTWPNCKSKNPVFDLQCKLQKHLNNHTRPNKCDFCTTFPGGAEWKDLARHVRKEHADHPAVRANRAYWKEVARCPRCDKKMRADNLKRHLRTCKGRGRRRRGSGGGSGSAVG